MLNKSLCFMLALVLILCCACSSDSSMKRYAYDDFSYSVPASWDADVSDPDTIFMQYSEKDGKTITVSKYENGSIDYGSLFDHLDDDGIEYEATDCDLKSGVTAHGAVYENEDGYLVAVFPFDASNGDEYRITFIQKELDADFTVDVLNSVEVK